MTVPELYEWFMARPKRRPDTSISLESCEWLVRWLDIQRPARLTDWGSGLSSLVIRQWAAAADAEVWTTDHDPTWLDVTVAELAALGLPTTRCLPHEDLAVAWHVLPRFDFVFLDLGKAHPRVKQVRLLDRLLEPDGIVVMDDWHMVGLAGPMTERLEGRGYEIRPLPETVDKYGRYMAMAWRSAAAVAHD